jgi:spermidine synthase
VDPAEAAHPIVLGRLTEAHGEVTLRRRGEVVELIVDGGFAMDTTDTSTERALATSAIQALTGDHLHVVVGGLGLGFTLAAALSEARVRQVHVVELSAGVVDWVASGLVPETAGALHDPRVTVTVGDVRDVVPALPAGGADAVLLDLDNGPDFLLHPANAAVYGEAFLTAAVRALRPGGVLAVWSAEPSAALRADLAATAGKVSEVRHRVLRDGRGLEYTIYLGHRDPRG